MLIRSGCFTWKVSPKQVRKLKIIDKTLFSLFFPDVTGLKEDIIHYYQKGDDALRAWVVNTDCDHYDNSYAPQSQKIYSRTSFFLEQHHILQTSCRTGYLTDDYSIGPVRKVIKWAETALKWRRKQEYKHTCRYWLILGLVNWVTQVICE